MPRPTPIAPISLAVLFLASVARNAEAAPPWVERRLTLPSSDWAFDVGLGYGHIPFNNSAGMNLEAAVSVVDHLELGLRTGLRFGNDFERGIHPDEYARLFDRQYVGGGDGAFANPEARVRYAFVEGEIAGVGVEGRVTVPLETGTTAALTPGLPLAFHLGRHVRLDTGVWLPIVTGGRRSVVSANLPLDVWIQATPRLWLGPMTGLRAYDLGGDQATTLVPFGFGLGYQIASVVDFKTQMLFPILNRDSGFWGLGAGVQIRIE